MADKLKQITLIELVKRAVLSLLVNIHQASWISTRKIVIFCINAVGTSAVHEMQWGLAQCMCRTSQHFNIASSNFKSVVKSAYPNTKLSSLLVYTLDYLALKRPLLECGQWIWHFWMFVAHKKYFPVTFSGDGKRIDRSPADAFLEALDSLSRTRIDLLEEGINKAKHRLTLIMNQARTFYLQKKFLA